MSNQRKCLRCGEDITARHGVAIRCVLCAKEQLKENLLAWRKHKTHRATSSSCLACGTDISSRHWTSKRCVACSATHSKERAKERVRERTGQTPWTQKHGSCAMCGIEIQVRSSNHRYCLNCAVIHNRQRDKERIRTPKYKEYKKKYRRDVLGQKQRQPNCPDCGTPVTPSGTRCVTCKASKAERIQQFRKRVAENKAKRERLRIERQGKGCKICGGTLAKWMKTYCGSAKCQRRGTRTLPSRKKCNVQRRINAKILLKDSFVKERLRRSFVKSGLPLRVADLPRDYIDAYREVLRVKRLVNPQTKHRPRKHE